MNKNQLLTTVQAADIVGLTRTSIIQAITNGYLKARKISRVWVIRRSDLDQWIAAGRVIGQFPKKKPEAKD